MQEQAGSLVLLMGHQVTSVAKIELGSIGLTFVHAIIESLGELPNAEHRDRLEVFIALGPGFGFQIHIASLLNDIGHRHEGNWIVEGLTQSRTLFLEQLISFVCTASPLGGFDEVSGEQRQNRLKTLLARGLCTQNTPSLFHLAALLPTAVARSRDQVRLDLLPSDAFSLTCKRIQLGPEFLNDRIHGGPTRIEQPQRLRRHEVRQADGKREQVRLSHAFPQETLAAPVWRRPGAPSACGIACRTSDQKKKR